MKAIVGIDSEGHYLSVLHLLSRLGFNEPSAELVHVEEVMIRAGAGVAPFSIDTRSIDSARRDFSEKLLKRARGEAELVGIESTTLYCLGHPVETLMDRAGALSAELVAVGSTHKSAYGALFLGSVGRGLTVGAHQSVLISKQEFFPSGPLTCVFATDGSDYADDCLRLLARWRPSGIKHLAVLTAVDKLENGQPPKAIKTHVDSLVSHLCDEGFSAKGHVVEGSPREAIDAMMESTHADLLIMGAQGHGVIERLFVGSHSLQEVVGSRHSILLLRKA